MSSDLDLTPVSYVVLGLVARDGALTPYELKGAVGRGIAYFWQFPHSQIYSETQRLASAGLLAEERETDGRRRRVYRITQSGRAALKAWLAMPAFEPLQIRSLSILKLYFGYLTEPESLEALAAAQLETSEQRRELLETTVARLSGHEDRRWQLAVARMAFSIETAMAESWAAVRETAKEERLRRDGVSEAAS